MSSESSKVNAIAGRAIALVGDDIDTDRIIPARFLRCVTFEGLGEQVFADDRSQTNGQHPFDQPQYQGAKILVVNGNFGCGSSREHAPQAIARWGIEAIVGESFAEIFFGNCVAMGVPCLTASPEVVAQLQTLIEQAPATEFTVDLNSLLVSSPTFNAPITLPDGPRQMFLSGTWDACGQLVAQAPAVKITATKLPYMAW
jgi:3-isopropylmalate/(R)-2-methylmalate dehydratase small subunit